MNWKIDPQLVDSDLGADDIALIHLQTKRIYSMNAVGKFIWDKLKDGQAKQAICQELAAEFSIDTAQAGKDFDCFVEDLKDKKLLS